MAVTRLYAYLIAIAGCVAILGSAAWHIDRKAYHRGIAACMEQRQKAADKVQAETNRRDERSAEAGTNMLDYLRAIPKIEAQSHDSAERVRVVYRSLPASTCVFERPASVQAELDTARNRAATAISAM